jgi:hypothetical protein
VVCLGETGEGTVTAARAATSSSEGGGSEGLASDCGRGRQMSRRRNAESNGVNQSLPDGLQCHVRLPLNTRK